MDTLEYKKILSKAHLEIIEAGYGIKINSIKQQFSGADRNSFIYKVTTSARNDLFLKIRTGELFIPSLYVPYLLSQSIQDHIIEPMKTHDNNLFLRLPEFTAMVYPYIDGSSARGIRLSTEHWIELGRVLKKIHNYKLPDKMSKIAAMIPAESYDDGWRKKLTKIIAELNNKERDSSYTKQFIFLYEQKSELIKFMIDRAEDLLAKTKDSREENYLCHGDIHAGNMLITREKYFYVVDWDTLVMAPRERDLMFFGGGVANTWNKKEETEYFFQGYSDYKTELSESVNQDLISYFRFERIIIDLVEYYDQFFADDFTDTSVPKNYEIEKNRKAILERVSSIFYPQGVVDMAFQ